MRSTIRPLLLAVGASTLVLAACSSGSDVGAEDPVVSSAATSDSDFNNADVTFAQGMIPHHDEAVEMAAIALEPSAGASAEIQALATQIQGAQEPEIVQMSGLLEAWGKSIEMEGMEGMEGMSAAEMTDLAALSGPEFDLAWATAMIAHHEGAVAMAETVKQAGSNAEVLALADAIIAAQNAEIDQMRAMLDR